MEMIQREGWFEIQSMIQMPMYIDQKYGNETIGQSS
jgi:hypothetical protein